MKSFVFFCVLALAAATILPSSASAHKSCTVRHHCGESDLFRGDDVDVDFDHGSILFTNGDNDETVTITEDGGLAVNGRPVRLARDHRKLVEDYYETFDGVMREAKEIGIEGAKIGVKGAALGISAVVGALLSISNDRDSDDVEHELDRKGEKIERMADRLEKRAARLEVKAQRLEAQHDNLRSEIGELDDLGWF
jgi:hypothetical protein